MALTEQEEREIIESLRRGVTQKVLAQRFRVGQRRIRRLGREHGVKRAKAKPAEGIAEVALANWEPVGSMPTSVEIAEACQLIRRERARREAIDDSGLAWTVPTVRAHSSLDK